MDGIGKGICRLSVVPVRKSPGDTYEMVTQLLFGDHYSVMEESADGNWVKIKAYFDDYTGWIDKKQHKPISVEYFDEINANDFKICTEVCSPILYKKKPLQIVIGSILPISNTELFDLDEQFAFNGESKNLGQRQDYEFVRSIALKYLNSPYFWGGKTPFGIDCSGFVQMVFKIAGYRLKRDSIDQVNQGREVEGIQQYEPGDLAFFSSDNGKVSHVGILLDDHKIIHASGQVRVDNINELGIFIDGYQHVTHRLSRIKRILK